MKNFTTLLILLIGFSTTVISQSRMIESDTIIESEWVDDNWKVVSIDIAITNTKDTLIQLTYNPSPSGKLLQTGRQTRTYNQAGHIEKLCMEIYIAETDTYLKDGLIEYLYDQSGNQVDFQCLKWDTTLNHWSNLIRQEHLDYDGNNNCGRWINYNGDDQDWIKSSVTSFERYYENEVLDSLFCKRKYEDGTLIPFFGATKYERDSNGLELFRTIYKADLSNVKGLSSYSVKSEYDERTSLLSMSAVIEYDKSIKPYVMTETDFQWRGDGSSLSATRYQLIDGERRPEYLIEYREASNELSTTLELSTLIIDLDWTSESQRELSLQLNNLMMCESYTLNVVDMSGRVIKNLTITNSQEWSTSLVLNSGNYVLSIENNDEVFSEQVNVK